MLIGAVSDRFGQFRILLLTISITAVGSFLDATASGVITLSVWRSLTGMGVGADLNLVSTYLSELAPPSRRGRIANLTFLVGIIGQAITPFVALALVPNYSDGWRLLFVIGGVIATIGFAVRFEVRESPRWLALHGWVAPRPFPPPGRARRCTRPEIVCRDLVYRRTIYMTNLNQVQDPESHYRVVK